MRSGRDEGMKGRGEVKEGIEEIMVKEGMGVTIMQRRGESKVDKKVEVNDNKS